MMPSEASRILSRILADMRSDKDAELLDIAEARMEVFARYQPVFAAKHIPDLTAEEFKSFLLFKNNRHWKSIQRQSSQIVADMDRLRSAVAILLDESRALEDRLRELRPLPPREPMVKGLARSVITPILLVAHPTKYGVLNKIAENALRNLKLWPDLPKGSDFATKYVLINDILLRIAKQLGIDLWTLDALWWRVDAPPDDGDDGDDGDEEQEARFGLEKHLHDFLYDNWSQTELGRDWDLLEEDGEIVGYKYNAQDIGEIDLLAKHRSEPKWLVIELKRGRSSDRTVGQLLRYRGWVRRHLATEDEEVVGLVICHEADQKLLYALDGVDGVGVRTYSVAFDLKKAGL